MENYDFSRNTHYTVAAFIIFENKILLLNQKKSPYWLLPGGHIEDDELPQDAIYREVFEETGLTINLIQKPDTKAKTEIVTPLPLPHHIQLVPCRDKRDVTFVFTALSSNNKIILDKESIDYHWFSKQELLELTDFKGKKLGPNTKYYGPKIIDEQ
ncbi:NUDIX domain-containing protein [Candidatus Micrarchaeota archaeon]|nr:NUDIX domain-containing protein [Candidatus Micrarchaeota archaeon]